MRNSKKFTFDFFFNISTAITIPASRTAPTTATIIYQYVNAGFVVDEGEGDGVRDGVGGGTAPIEKLVRCVHEHVTRVGVVTLVTHPFSPHSFAILSQNKQTGTAVFFQQVFIEISDQILTFSVKFRGKIRLTERRVCDGYINHNRSSQICHFNLSSDIVVQAHTDYRAVSFDDIR
jgi:hypothetical protein